VGGGKRAERRVGGGCVMRAWGCESIDPPSGEFQCAFLALIRPVSSVCSQMTANMLRTSECGRAKLLISGFVDEAAEGDIPGICDLQPYLQHLMNCRRARSSLVIGIVTERWRGRCVGSDVQYYRI
jgi:hypothetical protein